jgi:signal transduction histidine kinase
MARLRPFMRSPQSAAKSSDASATAGYLLGALCREVLDTAHAQLIPLGSMATLAGPALLYPAKSDAPQRPPPQVLHAGVTPLDPAAYAPYRWAIGLWGEWGANGVLMIGEKCEGGLYSQEEMEIAQATAERILQLLASEQMLRRLRALHDEILPSLHLAILQLNRAAQDPPVREALHSLSAVHQEIAALLVQTQPAPAQAPDPCELGESLRALVDSEFARHFAEVHWHTPGERGGAAADGTRVDALTGEVIIAAAREAIRNAALHGRGGRADFPLRLTITLCKEEGMVALTIEDNGVGLDAEQRAAQEGGSGSGLALHSTLLAMVGGYLAVEALDGGGTLARITVKEQGQPGT